MGKFSFLKEKIFQYLEFKGITKSDFYKKTGITSGTLSHSSGLGEENLLKIFLTYKEISLEWMFRGEGQMIRGVQENPPPMNVAHIQGNKNNITQEGKTVEIESNSELIQALKDTIASQKELIEVQKILIEQLKKEKG